MKKNHLVIYISALSIAGCGYKGPLYLPNHNQQRPTTNQYAPRPNSSAFPVESTPTTESAAMTQSTPRADSNNI